MVGVQPSTSRGSDPGAGEWLRPRWKIIQVCSSVAWGGREMFLPLLSRKLLERGHRVLGVCHPAGKLRSVCQELGMPVFPILNGRRYPSPMAIYRLTRLFWRETPDLVHSHLSRDLWQIVPATRYSNHPALFLSKHVGSYVNKRDLLHRWVYRHVDRVTAVSEVIRRNVLATCPMPPERVRTIHAASDLQRFDPVQVDRQAVRQALGIPVEALVVGMAARFSPGKGHQDFLRAARLIVDRYPEGDSACALRFLVVGGASLGEEAYYQRIVALAAELNLSKRVIFAGHRTDMAEVLAAMDLFLFPSHAETFGSTLIEAMAMEKPVVATDCDGVVDIVEKGVTGLQVPPGRPDLLAEAALQLIAESERARRMGEAGRRRVRALFDLETMTTRFEALYQEVLALRVKNEEL